MDLEKRKINVGYFLNEKREYIIENSDKEESVFTHIKHGIDFLYDNQGVHALGLWRGGDWNDSINNCGLQDIGESVWFSIATVKATNDYIEILQNCSIENGLNIIEDIQKKRSVLKENKSLCVSQ